MNGLAILLGPPGTGKTTRLLEIVENLGATYQPQEICYVAFTRKAANEAKTRAIEKFGWDGDSMQYFCTLHSLAFKSLGIKRTEVMGVRDYFEICSKLGLRISFNHVSDDGMITGLEKGDRLLFMENLARVLGKPLKELWEDHPLEDIHWEELELVAASVQRYKQELGKIDYTDLIVRFNEAKLQIPIKALIVDEAQDLSPTQWRMVEHLSSLVEETYVAGDDDQAIFKWAGADVDYFINLKGQASEVLSQSYRVPRKIQAKAQEIVDRIKHRREKTWSARDEDGEVHYHTDVEQIDMSQGTWLLLGRNVFALQQYNEYCTRQGYLFESRIGAPIEPGMIGAIKTWEDLRKGRQVPAAFIKPVYELMKTRSGVKHGYKQALEAELDGKLLTIFELQSVYGLQTTAPWYEALERITPAQSEYLRSALGRGEKPLSTPRIKINTIHGVKGGEAENVVICSDMAARTFREFERDPDDEARVWYVAVTRAKKTLHILQPISEFSFPL